MSGIIMKAVLVENLENINIFSIDVNIENHKIVRLKLEEEREKIIKILKNLKEEGKIKSIFIPKNKKMQKQLNNLVHSKRTIKHSLEKIKEVFYR